MAITSVGTVEDIMEKAFLMLNPRSGTREGKLQFFNIVNTLSEKYDLRVHLTKSTQDIIDTAKEITEQTVIVCGGDGTLSHTLEGLRLAGREDITVGYLPCGTANDVASTLGLPKKPVESAKRIISGKPIRQDHGSFNGKSYIDTASFGTFTKASYETSQDVKNVFGSFAYFMNGLSEILNLQSISAKIEYEGGVINETDIAFAAIGNTRVIGGGIVKLPPEKALLDDGKLDMLIIRKPKNAIDLDKIIKEIVNGNFDNEFVSIYHSSFFKVNTGDGILWTVDGDAFKAPAEVNIECVKGGVSFIR